MIFVQVLYENININIPNDTLRKEISPHGEREKIFDPSGSWTHNLRNRSPLLYQPSYKPYWLHSQFCVHLMQITILISHDQLPSGLVVQLVEQRWFVPRSWVWIPPESEIFFSFFSFLGLLLRRYRLGNYTSLQLTPFKPLHMLISAEQPNLTGYFYSI